MKKVWGICVWAKWKESVPKGLILTIHPHEMNGADLAGKTLIHSTRAGTVGVTAAVNANVIYGGALVNARATVQADFERKLRGGYVGSNGLGWA